MSFDLEPLPDTPQPPPQSVDRSRPCLSCGYNIRGLPVSGNCPECGVPVARSLQGNLLMHAAPEHVAALHHGTVLILAGKIVALLLQLGVVLVTIVVLVVMMTGSAGSGGARGGPVFLQWMSTPEYRFFSSLGELATSSAVLIGWWMLSRPDPGQVGADDLLTARKLVRVAVAIQLAAGLLTVTVHAADALGLFPQVQAPPGPKEIASIVVAIVSGVAALVGFFVSMRYLCQMARRIPSDEFRAECERFMWLGPLIYVVGLICIGLGPLAAQIMYVFIINKVRQYIKEIREEQEFDPARLQED